MKIIIAAALLAGLLLSACSMTHTYVKPDGTPLAQRDAQECEYEALKATAGIARSLVLTETLHNHSKGAELRMRCLQLRGYVAQ